MFIKYIIALVSVGLFVILAEVVSRLWPKINHELTRKIAHIGSAIAISVWPFYLSWEAVRILGAILTLGVIATIYFKLAGSIHNVARKNYGEILFGVVIIAAAFLARTPAIFCVAILFMGLADGLAAVVGTLWGKGSEYRVFGTKKSWLGSTAFFITALAITLGYSLYTGHILPPVALVALPLIATLLESVGLWGTDNVTVPIFVIIVLNIL